jgi:cobalamin synthase
MTASPQSRTEPSRDATISSLSFARSLPGGLVAADLATGAGAITGCAAGLMVVAGLRHRFGHLAGDFLGAGGEAGFVAGLATAAIVAGA